MEFLTLMLQIWERYWNLFLEGLWMTVYMGLVTVMISTVSGSLMALLRRQQIWNWKIQALQPDCNRLR